MKNGRGFTLIELLIVVAIIAILAAIAVPNFFEAQVRSKIARAHSDLRTIATALEAYRVDHPRYPPAVSYCTGMMASIDAYNRCPLQLTTPVAYLSSLPRDPFNVPQFYKYLAPGVGWANNVSTILHIYVPENFPYDEGPEKDIAYFNQQGSPVQWGSWSAGPSGALAFSESAARHLPAPPRCWYDPSNGTRSEGTVVRLSTGHQAPKR